MKKYIPYIVIAILLFSGGVLIAHFRGNAAVAEAKAKAAQDKADALAVQIKGLSDQIARSAAELAQFEADAAAREKWFQVQLANIKTATPQQLVVQGAGILGVTDVTTDGRTVQMGVESWRLVVADLMDLKEYRETREPGWVKEKGLLNDQIAAFKAQAALDAQKDAALAASIADLKSFISQRKVASTLEKVLWAGAGIGVGVLAGHLLR